MNPSGPGTKPGWKAANLVYMKADNALWRVKRERAPIAVNRLGCTTSEML